MSNFLRHMVANEVGTSAFLATLLDPRHEGDVFTRARAAIADVLRSHGVDVSSPHPTSVELEYLNIDLVALWSPWIICIENKVAAASITRGQLNDYYSTSVLQLQRNAFLGTAGKTLSQHPLCFIYLTPTPYTGMMEFETLELDRNRADKKIHVSWSEILDALTPLADNAIDHLSWFLQLGLARVRNILDAAKKSRLPEDECRCRLQATMNEMKDHVQRAEWIDGLSLHRWSDRAKEQLFAAGAAKSGYLGVYISHYGTSFPSDNSIRAVGDISFEVARKDRRRLRGFINSKSREEWATVLGTPSTETILDIEKACVSWRFSLPEMPTDDFVRRMATQLATFFYVFRSVLTEAPCDGMSAPLQRSNVMAAARTN